MRHLPSCISYHTTSNPTQSPGAYKSLPECAGGLFLHLMKLFKSLFKKRPDSDLMVAKDLINKIVSDEDNREDARKERIEKRNAASKLEARRVEQACSLDNEYLKSCEILAPVHTEFQYIGIQMRILRYDYQFTTRCADFSGYGDDLLEWYTKVIGTGTIHCEYWVDTVGFVTRDFLPEDLKSILSFPDRTPFVFKED